jgi:3-hydroxybutyryl-CoA dehydrogenase
LCVKGDAMKRIGILGCGLMGSGIAEISALSGHPTTVVEINEELLKKGVAKIEQSMEKGRKRGKITEEQFAAAKKNLFTSTGLAALKDCDLVIEAVTENTELKKKLFKDLSDVVRADAILATNTSSISVTELAAGVRNPERMVGMHFFNPVPVMKLVEIIKGYSTSDAVMAAAREFALAVGKEPITCPDTPAFVVNKLLIPYLLDAVRMVQDGVATPEDVDKAMVHGCGYPMGPITLIDYVGLDTTLHAADVMYAEFRETKYAAPVLLRRMVQAGHYGRKSGRGFYAYQGK